MVLLFWCQRCIGGTYHYLDRMGRTSRVIGFCSAANFVNAADRVIMPIAIIQLADVYDLDLHLQGWILSAFAFGYIASQLTVVLGYDAASRFGGRKVLVGAVFLWSLSTVATPLAAPHASLLILTRVLLGFGEGLGLPTVFHIYSHTIPVEERSRAFGYLIGMGSIGQTIASLVCPHLPWPWMFYIFGTLGLVWVAVFMMFYHDEPDNLQEELYIIPKVSNENVRTLEFIMHWPLWAIYIAHFAMNWSSYIFMQWLPTYLARHLGADKEAISLTAVPYVMNSLCGVVAGHVADSMVSRQGYTLLYVRRLMTAVGLMGPGLFILLFSSVNSLVAAVVFVSLSMGLLSCNSAGHLSNHAEVAPNHAGITFAISNTLATIPGILCGPVTAQLVVASAGRWWPVFTLAAAVNWLGAVVYCSQSLSSQVV